jgi:cyclophilin family peptidyl-prolyl cis-trans isomerase
LKLDSTADHVDHVFQEFVTQANETYLVTFDLQGQIPTSGLVTENVEVYWNGDLVGEFESTSFFTTHAFAVTGAAGNSRLEFREAASGTDASGNGIGVLIDNVNVAVAAETTGVTNGSFETVTGEGPFYANGNVPGWFALDRGDRPDLIQVQENGDNTNAPATDGVHVLNLDTNNDTVDHVYSDFSTVDGRQYFVTFDLFADGDQSATEPDEVRVRWRAADSEIQTDQWIATVFGNNTWQSYGFMVTGLGDLSRLELREPANNAGDGSGALIDNVRLYALEGIVNDLTIDGDSTTAGSGATAELVQGASGVALTPNLTLSHPSGQNLTNATITIAESVAQSEDELSINVGASGITQEFDAATGVLSLAGTANVATWQNVLRNLRYSNNRTTATAGAREISIVVSDATIIGANQNSDPITVDLNVVSNSLSLAPVAAQTVEAGSPLWVSLDLINSADVPLQFTGVSADTSLVTPRFETGDSWRLNISAPDVETNGESSPLSGEMTFQLFESIYGSTGSRAVDRIRTLTNDGFFDGVEFHRIIDNFVIQGGDPTASGSGGSTLGDFDDQFSTLLQHNREGLLSYAKSLDDTNDSQFFITDAPTRSLDFQHTIFGVLTSGEELRDAINAVDTGLNPNSGAGDYPEGSVTISSAEIYQDNRRAALLLVAPEGVTGTTTLTVTARDAAGNETSTDITINVVEPADAFSDSNPFLDDIPDLTGFFGVERTFQLTSQDVENDSVRYLDLAQIQTINDSLPLSQRIQIPTFVSDDSFVYNVDIDTGLVTFTPAVGGASTVQFLVGVAQEPRSGEGIQNRNVDLQVVTLNVADPGTGQ